MTEDGTTAEDVEEMEETVAGTATAPARLHHETTTGVRMTDTGPDPGRLVTGEISETGTMAHIEDRITTTCLALGGGQETYQMYKSLR